ncbi:uncharacterized protein BO95DRAFT_518297 [Aspergillus brunneoviolaceus CBS 621.78]|uniref:Uncharacterized protein n=1 Tax=Aspergillus brunneoviolaceus CBS 621.78 TaxID=1450534 RepID=A0ACD1FVL3_9EURO|nr:hypothetical protein BO95DRAFT_518297 [Aspergillus brunneoviolaceus CBS 621.78]RAH40994.1 hypothetical protein BO95DRAFT_518297 [Aspergillus brunneoviolaceus CBS 621.78]
MMRLRETIRLPNRLNEEAHTYTTTRRAPRRVISSYQSRADTFNPNLPPAAFPTLDRPRHPQLRTDDPTHEGKDNGSRKRSYDCMINNADIDGPVLETAAEPRAECEEIPVEQIDNLIVSNGELNPIYVKNMAIMAQAESESATFEKGMEDSDTDEEEDDEPVVEPLTASQWRDLSPQMQVEVFENVEESHSRPARILLGISEEDMKELERNRGLRAKQLEKEDRLLEAMRGKQLGAILRTNNVTPRATQVQPKVACQMILRQSLRKIKRAIEPDFLICLADEVLRARRFLLKREMDGELAGDWRGYTTRLQISADDLCRGLAKSTVPEPRRSDASAMNSTGGDAVDNTALRMTDRTSAQVSEINGIGTKCPSMLKDILSCQGQVKDPPRWLLLSHRDTSKNYHHPNRDNHIHTQLVSEERLAQRTHPELQYIQPKNIFKEFPPLSLVFFERCDPILATRKGDTATTSGMNERHQRYPDASTGTSQRAAGGSVSIGSGHSGWMKRMTVSMRIRNHINGMVKEAHKRMSEGAAGEAQQEEPSNCRKLLPEDIWTPPTSPSQVLRTTDFLSLQDDDNYAFAESAEFPGIEDTQAESSDGVMDDMLGQDTGASSHTTCESDPVLKTKKQSNSAKPDVSTRSESESVGSDADEYDTADEMVLVQVPI